MSVATDADGGQIGLQVFVVKAYRATDAVDRAMHEALTPRARKHRRGAGIRPGSVTVTLWQHE
ncbi:hypothetical protein [Streptomyces sp. NPDC058989]|uniref:hypothetical protein n=1 Tax=Streptomyces sp. NPDC058989 TaxID=3346686 RepID=UPI003676DF29